MGCRPWACLCVNHTTETHLENTIHCSMKVCLCDRILQLDNMWYCYLHINVDGYRILSHRQDSITINRMWYSLFRIMVYWRLIMTTDGQVGSRWHLVDLGMNSNLILDLVWFLLFAKTSLLLKAYNVIAVSYRSWYL